MSFKDIKVYEHERTAPRNKIAITRQNLTALLSASEGESFSSSIRLEFHLGSSRALATGHIYPFNKFYTDRIMIVRNRFDVVHRNHYKLSKGSRMLNVDAVGERAFDTYMLELYLSGMKGNT